MTPKTYQAAVYVRRIATDLICPEDEDPTCVRQLQMIQEYLEKKRMWNMRQHFPMDTSRKIKQRSMHCSA